MADMGGRNSSGAPWGRRTNNHLLRAAAIAAVTVALPLMAAPAASAATRIVPTDHGLSEPAGVAVTPDGAVWVSDGARGLCRVDMSPDAGRDRLVEDEAGYCAPEVEGPDDQPPPGPPRPSATFQIAFDAKGCEVEPATTDPARCNFYVAEGTSASSGVWRMHWNPATKTIDTAEKIYSALGDNRIFGIALSPEGHVDFTSKRDNIVRRLSNPGGTPFFLSAEAIGFSQGEGVASLAHLGQALYLAEGDLTRIDAPGAQGGLAVTVPGLGSGTSVGAVAADPAEGVVYAGTSNGDLTDSVIAVTTDGVVDHDYDETVYANVTALGLRPDGSLLIGHDPTAAVEPGVDTIGRAELFEKGPSPLNKPRVTLTGTPQPVQSSGDPADTTFRFLSRQGTAFSCTLDEAAVPCAGTPDGEGEFVPEAEIEEGVHRFEVWATALIEGSGAPTRWAFRIDHTAPEVSIDAPTAELAVGGALRVYFSSNEAGVSFECSLGEDAPAPCGPTKDLAGLAMGPHTFSVTAIDAAGNRSEPATWSFTAVPGPPATPGPPTDHGNTVKPLKPPIRVVASRRKPRQEIYVPCVEVSPSRRAKADMRLISRRARVRFRAPAEARYAKVTLRRSSGRRSRARIVETLGYARIRATGARHHTRFSLTKGQRRAVRAERMRLAIAYGTCRTQVGQWQWLKNTNQEGSR